MASSTDTSVKVAKTGRKLRRKKARLDGQPGAVDLIEEGVHLLRQTSVRAWAVYLCGVAPFLVGFLFFWTEMASSGLAREVLVPGAMGLAVLFVWLKVTQVFFAHGLRQALHGNAEPAWSWRTWLQVTRRQMSWQPTGLVAVPIAFVLTIPFAWVFTFYQNLLVLDPEHSGEDGEPARESWRLSRIWHEQNWMLLTLLSLVYLLTLINWLTVLLMVPYLLKTILGIETVFSRAGIHMINSTSLFACMLLAYVVTDPLVKAVYLLRLHYCESIRSGADLLLRLRRSVSTGGLLRLLLLGLVFLTTPFVPAASSLLAQENQAEPAFIQADTERLEESIEQVLQRREFVWRFPRDSVEKAEEEESGFQSLMETLERWQEKIERWIEGLFSSEDDKRESSESGWEGFPGLGNFLSYALITIFVVGILYFTVRALQMYRSTETVDVEELEVEEVVPDLNEEDVPADRLPRNRWVEMARELASKGEYRLALRAYFLAQLSAFSSEGLIIIRQAKSNREYAAEIARRGHGDNSLLEIYRSEVRLFESIWYGGRPSGPDEIAQMEGHLQETGVLA